MDLNNKYKVNSENISFRVVGDEVLILNLDNGSTFSLNLSGTHIWKALDKGYPLSEILTMLAELYNFPKEELKKDMFKLVKSLLKEQLTETF